jgi:hypothetical protein
VADQIFFAGNLGIVIVVVFLHLQNNWCQLAAMTNTSENVDFETYASINDELIVAE